MLWSQTLLIDSWNILIRYFRLLDTRYLHIVSCNNLWIQSATSIKIIHRWITAERFSHISTSFIAFQTASDSSAKTFLFIFFSCIKKLHNLFYNGFIWLPDSSCWVVVVELCWSPWGRIPATHCTRSPAGTSCSDSARSTRNDFNTFSVTLMDFPSFMILLAASLVTVLASDRRIITCLHACQRAFWSLVFLWGFIQNGHNLWQILNWRFLDCR